MEWYDMVKDMGFPIFVAVFVLVRLEPAIRRLGDSITALMVVTAKSNGMKQETVDTIVEAAMNRKGRKRRASDAIRESKNGRWDCRW
jgi:hypothetical protein